MKVAICFSGLLRSFQDCFPSYYENIIKHYDCDIFLYVPDEDDIDDKLSILDMCSGKKIIQKFNESDIPEQEYQKQLGNCTVQQVLRLMTYLKKVESMKHEYEKKHKFTYDWVFRCRCDTRVIKGPVEKLHNLNPNKIYIPNHDHWRGINDRFAFGSSKLMDLYHNRIDYLDEYFDSGGVLHDESYLRAFLEKFKIPICKTAIHVEILRPSGKTKYNIYQKNHQFPELNYNDKWNHYQSHVGGTKSQRRKNEYSSKIC